MLLKQMVANQKIHRVLVDAKSSVNIMFYNYFVNLGS